MGRIRTIKPEFFRHDGLAKLSPQHRLLFVGLWVIADREGRLVDRPARIWAEVSPYEGSPDGVDSMLSDLASSDDRFILRYEVDGNRYIQIPNFLEHQRPHPKDPDSDIPPPLGIEPKKHHAFAKEKHFESKLARLASEGGLLLGGERPETVECSKRVGNRYADIVCAFPSGTHLVIEVKKTPVSRAAIKQTLDYCDLLDGAVGLVVGTGVTSNIEPDPDNPLFVGVLNDDGNLELVPSFNVPGRHLTVDGVRFHAPLSNSPIVQESKSPRVEGGLGETIAAAPVKDPPKAPNPESPSVTRLPFAKPTRSDFDQFYRLYPKKRRPDRNKLKQAWEAQGCDEFADQIVADVSERLRNGTWSKNGDYVPAAAKYLEQRQWESEDPEATSPDDANLTPKERLIRRMEGK